MFIDLKYMSPYKIILIIGMIGFSLTSIALLFISIFGNDPDIKINSYGNINLYFSELKEKLNQNKKYFYLEIFIITPLYLFLEFLFTTCIIFIYKYLNPFYQLLSNNVYMLISKLINFLIKEDYNNIHKLIKFIINETIEFLELIAFIIYLEIIVLRFCGLNKYTRESIMARAKLEKMYNIYGSFNEESEISEEEDLNNEVQLLN